MPFATAFTDPAPAPEDLADSLERFEDVIQWFEEECQ